MRVRSAKKILRRQNPTRFPFDGTDCGVYRAHTYARTLSVWGRAFGAGRAGVGRKWQWQRAEWLRPPRVRPRDAEADVNL